MSKTLGQRIRRTRTQRDLGLREMARLVDISPTYLSRVETDEEQNPPAEETLKKIAEVLGENLGELMHLAGRVPSDVDEIVREDAAMPDALRAAKAKNITGEQLKQLIEKAKAKR